MFAPPETNKNTSNNPTSISNSLFSGKTTQNNAVFSLFANANASSNSITGGPSPSNSNSIFANAQMFKSVGSTAPIFANTMFGGAQTQFGSSTPQESQLKNSVPSIFQKNQKKVQQFDKKSQASSDSKFFTPTFNPIQGTSNQQIASNSKKFENRAQKKDQSSLGNVESNKKQEKNSFISFASSSSQQPQSSLFSFGQNSDLKNSFLMPASGNLFAQKNHQPQSNNEAPKQKAQSPPSLFGGIKPSGAANEKQTKALFPNLGKGLNLPTTQIKNNGIAGFFSMITDKKPQPQNQAPVLNTSPPSNLFNASKGKQSIIPNSQQNGAQLNKQQKFKEPFQKDASSQKSSKNQKKQQDNIPKLSINPLDKSLFAKKTEQKAEEKNYKSFFRQPLFKKPQQTGKFQELKATPSFTNLPTAQNNDEQKLAFLNEPIKNGQNKTSNQDLLIETGAKENKKSQAVNTNQQIEMASAFPNDSLKIFTTTSPAATTTHHSNTTKANPTTMGDKNQEDLLKNSTQAATSQPNQSFSSGPVKSKQDPSKNFIDFKTLKDHQNKETFDLYLGQKKLDIIQSLKIYLNLRSSQFKEKSLNENLTDKERFYNDLTNFFIKISGLDIKNYAFYEKFIQKVMYDERYQQRLFTNPQFFKMYCQQNSIYQKDTSGKLTLNETSSYELKSLMEKILMKWNLDKVNYINFLYRYPEFLRPKEELFSYLFVYLLKLEQPKHLNQELKPLRIIIRDYNKMTVKKISELLNVYNQKFGKNYKNLLTEEPSRFIISILPLIESLNNQNTINISLKILLNSIDLSQPQKLSSNLAKCLRQTKSIGLLPLRVILIKLKQQNIEFVPSPKDLFKYIKGDEWIDWIDIYLTNGLKAYIQVSEQESSYVVESLATINPSVLIERLTTTKKGVYKFFDMLKEENMINQCYKILQSCLSDEDSIQKIDQFYFKKAYLNQEYQEIKEFVVHFHQNIVNPQVLINQDSVLKTLCSKISLLSKIIQIAPQKIVEQERYIFEPASSAQKKLKLTEGVQHYKRQGHRMVHFFIDIINIVSIRGLQTKILTKVFRALTALLKSNSTQKIVITAMAINKPSFSFAQRHELPKQTSQAFKDFLDHIVSSQYLYDLIIDYNNGEQTADTQLLCTLRYNNIQYSKFMITEQYQPRNLSIYWMHQLFQTAAKQKFNPSLIYKLLSILKIQPCSLQNKEETTSRYVMRFGKRVLNYIPKVFQLIVKLVNSFSIWEEINRVLQYRLVKEDGTYQIISNSNQNVQNLNQYRHVLATLKLLKTIYQLNQVLIRDQQRHPNHFIIKTLAQVNILNKIQIISTISNSNKESFLFALVANIQTQQPLQNLTAKKICLQLQQEEQDSIKIQTITNYFKLNRHCLDLQQVTNFMKPPENMYYQELDNLTTLTLECIVYFLRLGSDNSIQWALMESSQFSHKQKVNLKADLMKKISNTLAFYCSEDEFKSIRYKIVQFIYNLKYGLGKNELNKSLGDLLFAEFLSSYKKIEKDTRLNHIILQYFAKESKEKSKKFENYFETVLVDIVNSLQLKDSHAYGNFVMRDSKEMSEILLKYHQKRYSFFSFNQLERIINEKSIIEQGQNLQTLTLACQILAQQISKKNFSHNLNLALNAVNRIIAQKNLILLINELSFDPINCRHSEADLQRQLKRPRSFLKDPLQFFISKRRGLQQKAQMQTVQKNNIIEWFIQISERFSNKLTNYLQFILTIDQTFYANNPINLDLSRKELANKYIFFHLANGNNALSAIAVFGKSQTEAVGVVQLMAENLLKSLTDMHHNIKISQEPTEAQKGYYLQGLKLLGFCIEWLRPRRKGDSSGANDIVRKLNRNFQILLPKIRGDFCSEQLKVIQSYMSIGEYIPNEIKYIIQNQLYQLINSYREKLEETSMQEDQSFGTLAQQAFSILLLAPPSQNQNNILEMLIVILGKQKKERYFFNECRLVVELANLYPEQMAKLNVLSQFEIFEPLSVSSDRYENDSRKISSMKWVWVLSIASALASNSESILVIKQVGKFVEKNKMMLLKTLLGDEKTLTRAYLQQLEVTLTLLSFLMSNTSWINSNTQTFEEITYILSHYLIQFFVGVVQGQIKPVAMSQNQKAFQQIRVSTIYQENQMVEDYRSEQLQSAFDFEMHVKAVYCLRFYLLNLEAGFQKSQFIQKYFHNFVYGTSRYLASFWDSISKNIIILFNHTINKTEYWMKIKRLKQIVQLMNNCYDAPHTFIQNGFLTSVIEVPRSQTEVYSDLYLLTYLIIKFAVTIYFQQKVFINKYNASTTSQNEHFCVKIKQQIGRVGQLTKKLANAGQDYIKYESFKKLAQAIDNRAAYM